MSPDADGEIAIIPLPHTGHLFPATDLANRLAARNYQITIILPPSPIPSFSSSASLHPLIRILPFEFPDPHHRRDQRSSFRDLMLKRFNGPHPSLPLICAIVDVMMSQLLDVCVELGIPAVSFFTCSACSTALDHATHSILRDDLRQRGNVLTVPDLPEDITISLSDLEHRGPPSAPPRGSIGGPSHPPLFAPSHPRGPDLSPIGPEPVHPHGPHLQLPPRCNIGGPHHPPPFGSADPRVPHLPPVRPEPVHPHGPHPPPRPQGLEATAGAIGLLFNTCDDLERPFVDYIAKETKKTVWAVGPLLPTQFWVAAQGRELIHDEEIRPKNESIISENEIIEWLDGKPRDSVIYVAFGSIVDHGEDELIELAAGLEDCNRPFIWVTRTGSTGSRELSSRAGGKWLVLEGWAPQLLILSHVATGGFISHCGWNSTVEAIGLGVPMLTWPVHGDQVHNAKLVTSRLKVGWALRAETRDQVRKKDVLEGIERLMTDFEMRERAAQTRTIFKGGFPNSSSASLDAFLDSMKWPL